VNDVTGGAGGGWGGTPGSRSEVNGRTRLEDHQIKYSKVLGIRLFREGYTYLTGGGKKRRTGRSSKTGKGKRLSGEDHKNGVLNATRVHESGAPPQKGTIRCGGSVKSGDEPLGKKGIRIRGGGDKKQMTYDASVGDWGRVSVLIRRLETAATIEKRNTDDVNCDPAGKEFNQT